MQTNRGGGNGPDAARVYIKPIDELLIEGRSPFNEELAADTWPGKIEGNITKRPDVIFRKLSDKSIKDFADARENLTEKSIRSSLGGYRTDWQKAGVRSTPIQNRDSGRNTRKDESRVQQGELRSDAGRLSTGRSGATRNDVKFSKTKLPKYTKASEAHRKSADRVKPLEILEKKGVEAAMSGYKSMNKLSNFPALFNKLAAG